MTEETESKGKVETVGEVGQCHIIITTDKDGKRHFEASCASKEARDNLAAVFEQEAVLRISPKAVVVDPAVPDPAVPGPAVPGPGAG